MRGGGRGTAGSGAHQPTPASRLSDDPRLNAQRLAIEKSKIAREIYRISGPRSQPVTVTGSAFSQPFRQNDAKERAGERPDPRTNGAKIPPKSTNHCRDNRADSRSRPTRRRGQRRGPR